MNCYFLLLQFLKAIHWNIYRYRSSHRRCSVKKGLACNFIKKDIMAQVFSDEFCEISKNAFSTEHLQTTASTDVSDQMTFTLSYQWVTNCHWVKGVRVRLDYLRFHSECRKIRTRNTPNTDTFYALWRTSKIFTPRRSPCS